MGLFEKYLPVFLARKYVTRILDLRHHINHPNLGTWGGHCGYSVRPSEREKGYAKEMLWLNIKNAIEFGIDRLLITCNVENKASEKIILVNGGIFEKIIDVDGCKIKRYWINCTLDSGHDSIEKPHLADGNLSSKK